MRQFRSLSLLLGKFLMTHLTDKTKGSQTHVLKAQDIEICSTYIVAVYFYIEHEHNVKCPKETSHCLHCTLESLTSSLERTNMLLVRIPFLDSKVSFSNWYIAAPLFSKSDSRKEGKARAIAL